MGYEVNVEELRVAEIVSNAELDQIETAALLMLVFAHYGQFCIRSVKAKRLGLSACAETFHSSSVLPQIPYHSCPALTAASLGSALFETRSSQKTFVDRVLAELRAHYRSTGKEFAERLDRITRVLGEFHVCLPALALIIQNRDFRPLPA